MGTKNSGFHRPKLLARYDFSVRCRGTVVKRGLFVTRYEKDSFRYLGVDNICFSAPSRWEHWNFEKLLNCFPWRTSLLSLILNFIFEMEEDFVETQQLHKNWVGFLKGFNSATIYPGRVNKWLNWHRGKYQGQRLMSKTFLSMMKSSQGRRPTFQEVFWFIATRFINQLIRKMVPSLILRARFLVGKLFDKGDFGRQQSLLWSCGCWGLDESLRGVG